MPEIPLGTSPRSTIGFSGPIIQDKPKSLWKARFHLKQSPISTIDFSGPINKHKQFMDQQERQRTKRGRGKRGTTMNYWHN